MGGKKEGKRKRNFLSNKIDFKHGRSMNGRMNKGEHQRLVTDD